MNARTRVIALVPLAAAAGLGIWLWHPRPGPRPIINLKDPRSPVAVSAGQERRQGDELYAKAQWRRAQAFYADFVKEHASDKDPDVQEEVGAARMRLGYALAKTDGYAKARAVFKEAVASYKGPGRPNSDFGDPQDQAAYQATVCLEASGRKREARKEYLSFLKDRPLSPLSQAVYRRLKRLNGGKASPEYDRLLQRALERRDRWVRLETATCGPKCIEYLLKSLGKPAPGYTELAKLCGTTERGTTIEGMRRGMKACGAPGYGFLVNRKDFAALPLPALWLVGDHYLVLVRTDAKYATVFDPFPNSERSVELPPLEDAAFQATVVALRTPRLGVKQ